MQNDYNINAYSCGASKESSSFLDKIRESKALKKWILAFAFAGVVASEASKAEAAEKRISHINYETVYASGNASKSVSQNHMDDFGVPHKKSDQNEIYISNKLVHDSGKTTLYRYEVSQTRQPDWSWKNNNRVTVATAHPINFLNPNTGEPETYVAFIENGQQEKEEEFIKKQIKKALENKIGHERITKRNNELYGAPVFSGDERRGYGNVLGYNHLYHGIIFVNVNENESNAFNTMLHELDHIRHQLIKSTQILEASARTIAFFGEILEKEKNPNHVFSEKAERLLPIYKNYENSNMPIDKKMLGMYLSSFLIESGVFGNGYDNSMAQFNKMWLDMGKAGIIPESLREEGRPTNFLYEVNPDDMKKAFEDCKKLTLAERWEILKNGEIGNSLPDEIVIRIYDKKDRKDIPIVINEIDDPKKAGFMELSENLGNKKYNQKTVDAAVAYITGKNSEHIG